MVVLKDFVLFLKQESGSRDENGIQQLSHTTTSKVKEFLKLFPDSRNSVNLAESILSSLLYYPASRDINSYLSSFFSCIFLSVVLHQGVTSLRLIHI